MGQVAVGAAAPSRRLRTQVFKHLENQQPHSGAMLVSGGEIVLAFLGGLISAWHYTTETRKVSQDAEGKLFVPFYAIICHSPTCLDRAFQNLRPNSLEFQNISK